MTDDGFKVTHLNVHDLTAGGEINMSRMAKKIPITFTIKVKGLRWFNFRSQLCLGLLHLAGWVGPADCEVVIEIVEG